MTETLTLNQLKASVRDNRREARSHITSATRRDAAAALCRHADRLNLPQDAIIAAYWPIGTEIDTTVLLRHLHTQGYKVALPRAVMPMAALRFFRWRPETGLVLDIMGFPAPLDDEEVTPDILFVPLVAFDARGNRLGQGGGFYDRTLHDLRAQNPVRVIGVAFASQLVTTPLPVEPHDEKLDLILTETGIVIPEPA